MAKQPPASIEGTNFLVVGHNNKPHGLPKRLQDSSEIVFR
jgi:hypothetical protein